jgi:hypothetical protein
MLIAVATETNASASSDDSPVVLIAKGMHYTLADGRPPQNPGAPGVPTSTTPWTPCGDFCLVTAYRCETSRNRVCLDELKVNGTPATLIDGFTGSCVTMHMTGSKHDIMKGCTPPSDDSGKSLDPDFIFVTEDLQVDCFVGSTSSKCLRTVVHLIPNLARAEQPILTRVDLVMRSPRGAPFSQRAGYALVNGVVEEFTPSTENSDLLRLSVVDPHRNVGLFAPDVRLSGRSCSWFSMHVDECSLADQVTKTERSLRVLLFPGPLRQRFNPSGLIEPSSAGIGTFFSTNAEHVGAPAASSIRGELTLQIAGPHHSPGGAPNLSWLVWYWPSDYLKAEFGLSPSDAGASTIDVNRSASGTVSNQRAVFEPQAKGLRVSVTDIGFSSPSIGARRIITLKVGGQISFSSLASAMGIRKLSAKTGFAPQFSKAVSRNVLIGKSSVRVLKRGSHELTFRFRDDFGKVRSKTIKVVAG